MRNGAWASLLVACRMAGPMRVYRRGSIAASAAQVRGDTASAKSLATAKLKREPMRMKVLIIVSDGYPEDQDYGPDRRDDEYGIQDTARALTEAAHAGISTFCITIDPAGHDYLRRMCSEHRYLVIDDVPSLPRELAKLYRSLSARPDPRHWAGPG